MAWVGECNRCGLCCQQTFQVDDNPPEKARCIFLWVDGKIGSPEATRCSVHSQRTVGMPILMVGERGGMYKSICLMNFPESHDGIPEGCSYKWEGDSPVPPRIDLIQIKTIRV